MTGNDGGPEPPRVLEDAGRTLDGGSLNGEDSGSLEDAGHVADAGLFDAGVEDAGGSAVDSGAADAGDLDDAGVLDAGAITDGGIVEPVDAGGDGGALSCGTLLALRDDFDDNARALQWAFSFEQGPLMSETEEELQFELGAEAGYSGYLSQHAGSLRDSSVTVRLRETFPSSTSGVTFLALLLDDDDQLLIGRDDVGFFASVINEGQRDRYAYANDDGGTPTWARIRHDTDTVYFELSVDGAAWNLVHQRTPPFPIDSLRVEIAAGQTTTPESGTARWDDLNTQGPETPWCPVESFDLDLGGEVLGASLVATDACTLTDDAATGELRFSDDDGDVACRVSSRDAFSLEDSFVAVHVKDRDLASTIFGGIAVADESFDYIDLGFTSAGISFSAPVTSGRAITTFSAGTHTWLALSADSQGRVAASASPDGVTWTRLHTVETVMPLDVVHVQMGLKEYAGESTEASQMTLSDINAPTTPPPAPLPSP